MNERRKLTPRNTPIQKRALERRDKILEVTAVLLEEIGQDDLTTILVAKRAEVSVGTLYHYFPNKYAILYALAERWLGEMDIALQEMEAEAIEQLSLRKFVERNIDRMLLVYNNQRGLLPLVQAMFGVPELKAMDIQHDELIITALARMFARLEIAERSSELTRLGRAYMEINHALLLVVVHQSKSDGLKTLNDLKYLSVSLVERAKSQF
ncbi:MAG: TetR/AcrR family transcriptional regulator [Porticoccaceae bacterium]|nr:MAG: transcriptional regulator [SAR92 bacterium BACL16 MAG-120619-bin48]MDP4655372.1 TetR/AcrR family transcriptional regulator [Alphaproteobacteria bacterium]MDP4753879.1 TetR/AcrR family transcriptional regulator [Porticoccaceae bacterium]MDP4890478.1 TetR/AcrR family transcriptional regulator [Porticoccaceae bacterium]MDP4987615.1 TetR/AcrR family transcriptional regulator [Porticoccaceae bacterium]